MTVAILGKNAYICRTMKHIKNIVFDLGGVVFSRDPRKFEPEFIEFFSYIYLPQMPHFWEEYDRGAVSFTEVVEWLADYNKSDVVTAERNLRRSIVTQEPIEATAKLISELRAAGYKLYVLSNMSLEFIEFLRRQDVYANFDGEVVSCEEGVIKPNPKIYRTLVSRYNLNPSETLFIDDRSANIDVARSEGWHGYHFSTRSAKECCEELRNMLIESR